MSWLNVAAIVVAAASGAYSAYSSNQQAKAQSRQSSYNALIAQQNAALAENQGNMSKMATELKAKQFKAKGEALKDAQRVAYLKSGVEMEGTPLIQQASTQVELDLDEMAIKYAGDVEYGNVLAKAGEEKQKEKLYRMQGTGALVAGRYASGGSLISGASSTLAAYGDYKKANP